MRSEQTIGRATRRLNPLLRFGLFRCVWMALLFGCVGVSFTPLPVTAQSATQREYEIKAAYLYNFINYIEWPAEALPATGGAITIGVLGDNPFGAALNPLNGKTVKGRTLVVKQVGSVKELEQCQIAFVCSSEKGRVGEILNQLKDQHILTVADFDGFAAQGGIINFVSERNKVRFEINLDAARRLGLTISSELLKLAKLVKS
jgi:hypothetical protein